MIVATADTHAAVWYLFSDPRLGSRASAFIDRATASGDFIGVSAITIAEMVDLVEKGRIPPGALNDLQTAIADPKAVFQHVVLDERIAMNMAEISRLDVPDLPDRVIAATARFYGVPLLSRDSQIRWSNIQKVW
jgi:PIN domain nuclease of toxin-antitoxin system